MGFFFSFSCVVVVVVFFLTTAKRLQQQFTSKDKATSNNLLAIKRQIRKLPHNQFSQKANETTCGSHLQSQSELYYVSSISQMVEKTVVIDLIGQSRDVIGRLSVKLCCYWL